MRYTLDSLYRISGWSAAGSLIAIALIIFTQVVFNVINAAAGWFLGGSLRLLIPSYAQLAGYALGWTTFLSLGLGFRKAAHIRVTLIEGNLPRPLRRVNLTIIAALGVGLSVIMVWGFGHLVWASWQWDDRASGLIRVPLWIPQSGILLGLIVMLVASLDTLVEMVVTGRSDALDQKLSHEDAHNE